MSGFQIIGADDCFTMASENEFDSESDASESLEFLLCEYPGLSSAYVAEIEALGE